MNKWISVKNKLPPKNVTVIGKFPSMYRNVPYHVSDCHYDGAWKMHGNDSVHDTYANDPVAWQPMEDSDDHTD
ncbi:hypothetical protein AD45P2_00300 [Alteromonas phage vB_AmaP_AD45-P2]|uniref:DUF551 domain-containing protein n=1 Tax=Pseudorhizobium pelagicum TaxID=1509405 RepID=A0A922T7C1_9HYPH|nr:hypothetical protein [Pseudorhizobium pelagicum]YP_008126031.1 hypothetical protein M610_gp060 [Alteromonas phage vB_AmaP_AD45-P1]AGM46999.1 hypothetical protein AD45P3_00305 [Alteromonas phage vB_AmaP_AD45-P3]AGM47115.1 hypothetical protein AD45P4_00300 [Alteromonas phage vB_AmaP_AD45-P4]AGM47231.1 hypothetical protein AD45P2_00300 [Alteromonas phage vB_AmaP_AD45-P2]AGM46878.1 hypothetical protein AD45P1_00300 [Alteromonas phage vB_AmaP_AD45-P1]KEQ05646.1 hypothetical protein GV68_08955 [